MANPIDTFKEKIKSVTDESLKHLAIDFKAWAPKGFDAGPSNMGNELYSMLGSFEGGKYLTSFQMQLVIHGEIAKRFIA